MLTMLVESERAEATNYETQPDECETSIKDRVRQRDGYKCRACGMTNEQHVEETGRVLDVHRLVPGVFYHPNWCVTLCRPCHDKQVRRTVDVFWSEEVRWIMFNMYNEADAAIWKQLSSLVGEERTLESIFKEGIKAVQRQRVEREALVTCDGLW